MRLDGLRILDLTPWLPAAYATQLLADLGAEVIKIEQPGAGDYGRYFDANTLEREDDDGYMPIFDWTNRGKKSVTLDLQTDAGQEAFHRMAAAADVVFESFRPGVVSNLGIDYESVLIHNSDIIYCSLSGFGQDGPLRTQGAHDYNYQALTGLLDQNRYRDSQRPVMSGYPIGDMAAGLNAAFQMVSAVLSRELGNLDGGTYIDVAFIDILFSFSQAIAPTSMLFDEDPRPGETLFTGKYPSANVYETADDRYVVIAAIEDHFWEAFCRAVGREDLVDVRMPDDEAERAALRSELETLFRSRTRDEWMELATDDIPITAVHTLEEAIAHPQIRSRELVEEHEELPPRIGYPAKPSTAIDGGGTPSPELGQHTAELLREHGYSPDEIEALRAEGVI